MRGEREIEDPTLEPLGCTPRVQSRPQSSGCGHKSVHVLEGEWAILVHRQRLTLRLKGQREEKTE